MQVVDMFVDRMFRKNGASACAKVMSIWVPGFFDFALVVSCGRVESLKSGLTYLKRRSSDSII
jgi:hypothetical protein